MSHLPSVIMHVLLVALVSIAGCGGHGEKGAIGSQPIDVWAAKDNAHDRLQILLAPRATTASVMQLMVPRRLTELSERFQQSAQENSASFLFGVFASKRGEPMPYSSSMGLSKDEYAEFLNLAKKIHFDPVRRIEVLVEADPNTGITWISSKDEPRLGRVGVDFNDMSIKTSFGPVLGPPTDVIASDGQAATGPWNGFSWKTNSVVSLLAGKQVNLNLGQMINSKEVLLNFDVRDLHEGQTLTDITLLLAPPVN